MSEHVQAFAMIPNRATFDSDLPAAALRWLCVIAACRDSKTGWTRMSLVRARRRMGLADGTNGSWLGKLTRALIDGGYIDHIPGKGRSLSRFRVIYDARRPSEAELAAEDADDEEDEADPLVLEGGEDGALSRSKGAGSSKLEGAEPSKSKGDSILPSIKTPLGQEREGVPPTPKALVDQMIGIWNTTALGTPKALGSSDARQRALLARLKDLKGDMESWRSYCAKISALPGLTGANNHDWAANIDWAIRPGNVLKVMEGTYNTWGKAKSGPVENSFRKMESLFGIDTEPTRPEPTRESTIDQHGEVVR